MKKICFVSPTLRKGGMERVVTELANYGVLKGYRVIIVCTIVRDIGYELNENVEVIGPNYIYNKGFFSKIKVLLFLYK